MANLHKIFVYGTLKKGEPNHHWFSKCQNGVANFVGEAQTSEKYPLVIATKYNIPFLLYSPGTGNNIRGELYEVDDATFEKLDELEDYPKFYIREQKTVSSLCGNTQHENCWIYFLKNYKPELLQKPMLKSYSDKGAHGLRYLASYQTNTDKSHLNEVMTNLHKIFVYGTLKKGEPNHHWFSKSENGVANFVCEAQTSEKYPLVIATKYNIPFLLYSPGTGNNIRGELYEVDDATFEKLDELEDYPKFYNREQKTVLSLPGNTKYDNCWIYFLKNYKPELLQKPMLQSYSNKGLNGLSYLASYQTNTDKSHLNEVMANLHKIFVYGTLKKGEPNHHWFSKSENGVANFVCEAQTTEKYPLVIATKYNIPFLLYSPGTGNNIRGELYEVDDATFEKLDELEDYPKFYIREQKTVSSLRSNTQHENCWIYFLKNYKPKLLQKPMLKSYSDKGAHGLRYLASYQTNTDKSHLNEVMANLHKIFVYGTLKKGEPNHHWFSKSENGVANFVCAAQTNEKYPLVIATKYNIPFLLYSPGIGNNIRGELYEVDDATFEKLDELEDYPKFYNREQKTVLSLPGNTKYDNCWIYFLKNYKPALLQKPMLQSYSNKGLNGLSYLASYQTNTDKSHLNEVMANLHKIFVYGTLKKGEPNHHWFSKSENGVANFVCEAQTSEKYPLVIATKYNIPFLLYSPGTGNNIRGELYEVDDATFEKLDELEDYPKFYIREQKTVSSLRSNTQHENCWIYFLKNYKPKLLQKPMLKSYSDKGAHGLRYLASYQTNTDKSHLNEVMTNLHKIFVYGTLKKGEPNHHWFSKSENGVANFVCDAQTSEKYPLVIATKYNIPFLLYSPGNGNNIRGELYEVDDATFEKLDELEDYPKFYIREQKTVLSLPGNTKYDNCWIYFLKNYKPELLQRPMLQSYSNKGLNGLSYLASYQSNTDKSHLNEVMAKLHKVFVYGTLKKGEPNHHWFSKCQNGIANFIGEAQTTEKYPLVIATRYNIPFLLYSPGTGNNIRGELYEVDDATFEQLDELEDYPNFYIREQKTVLSVCGNTQHENCWIYFLKNYKPELLQKPMLESYSDKGPHGLRYLERYLRNTDYNHLNEVLAKQQ